MRAAALVIGLLVEVASGAPARPIHVAIDCEQAGRTKACPAFLLGFLDAHPVLRSSPRATAEVIVYVTSTEVALEDNVHLRFVGEISGAPRVLELDARLDTRTDDDTQRAVLEAVFLRGIALYVGARYADAVSVTLADPAGIEEHVEDDTTPWGLAITISGSGNRTARYQSANTYASVVLSRLTRKGRMQASIYGSGGINRQPPLVLDDGTEVPLDTKQWQLGATMVGAWLYDDRWSLGGVANVWRDDPKGQHELASNVLAGIEWDAFAADDPRGNRLAVFWAFGYQGERYNLRNELGEDAAHHPVHSFGATGAVRHDKVSFGLSLEAGGQLDHPTRRYHVTASPFVEVQLGRHVDLSLSTSLTKRELPGPDETQIDPADYEQVSRLSYAEPLAVEGSLSLTIHWDRTNGARNDRFSDI